MLECVPEADLLGRDLMIKLGIGLEVNQMDTSYFKPPF